ncbi:hypothetical protein YC2023_072010 [Brassica napus]
MGCLFSTHTDVRVCPSAHTGRPWPSVSTHRTSGLHTRRPSAHAGRPWLSVCVRQCTQDVRQHTQDVRQHTQDVRQHTQDIRPHTQDVRVCPCVSVCPLAHAGHPSVHTGRPSAHKGRLWPSVNTHRTSVSTQRTSVAVRQHTQDVRQHTQDVRACPCVSVCPSVHTGRPSVHTGRPSAHTGRPWPVRVCPCVRQYTQDVLQHTQDVRGRPSVHIGRPWSSVSTHISMMALPVDCSGDFGPRGLSVQYTQDVRQHTQDVRACPLPHTDYPWTAHQYIYQHADHTYQHAGPSHGLTVMLTTHISMLVLPMDLPCTDFGQLMHHDAFGRDLCTCGLHFIGQSEILGGGSNLSDKGLNLSGSWQQGHSATYNTPSRRADIEGSKSNVAMNAWLPQASYPCGNFSDTSSFKFRRSKGSIGHAFTMCRPSQTPHLTMSSARIDPPKQVLGLKEGVVTPPPIHGSFHKVGLESSSTGSSFPADSAKPVPLAVVSLDSRQGQCRIPLVRTKSELAVRRPGKAPERAVPSPSPGRHEAVRSRHVSSSSSPPTVDGFGTGTPEPSPQSQSFSQSYGSILPTSLAYVVPSTRGCSPWSPDAFMSTTGRERHSVLRIFKGRRECTGHHATCGALPAAGSYLPLSRFQGGQAVKQKR